MDPLTKAFTAPAVQDLAGPGSYQRGVAYSRDGRVSASRGTGGRLEATGRGDDALHRGVVDRRG